MALTPVRRLRLLQSGFTAEANALISRFTTPPTWQRSRLINNTIVMLKNSGVWPLLDALYFMAAADSQAASLNWVQNTFNLTVQSGSPVFTADQGYTGDGATTQLNTSLNPATAGLKLSQNSVHLSVWSRTASPGVGGMIGENTDTQFSIIQTAGMMLGRVFDLDVNTIPIGAGFYCASRTGPTARAFYKGTTPSASSTASAAITSAVTRILAGGGTITNAQLASASIGVGLSDQLEAAIFNAVSFYLIGVGAA